MSDKHMSPYLRVPMAGAYRGNAKWSTASKSAGLAVTLHNPFISQFRHSSAAEKQLRSAALGVGRVAGRLLVSYRCLPARNACHVVIQLRSRSTFFVCSAPPPAAGCKIFRKTYRFSKARNLTPPECDIGFKCGRKSIAGLRADRENNLRRVIRSDPRFSGSAGRRFSIDVASHPRQRQTVRKGGTQSCGSVPVGTDSRAAEWVMQAARASTWASGDIPDRVQRKRRRFVFREFVTPRLIAHL